MIVISMCLLLLVAYIFDLTSAKTRVPTVILLLVLGWAMQQAATYLGIHVYNMAPLLPILGTIGLILIVLEGALELELNRSKMPVIKKAFGLSLLSILLITAAIAGVMYYIDNSGIKNILINAVPLGIISSAIAIPSVRNLAAHQREFVIYESSFSDILGVLLFNFMAGNEVYNMHTVGIFSLQILAVIVISFLATAGLALLIKKIDHHIKFGPIIILVILIYYVSKIFHLPGLIFILFFGLFLGNINELKKYKAIRLLEPDQFDQQVHKFKELTTEAAFLVRSLFFLIFGFLINTADILDGRSLLTSLTIVGILVVIRYVLLRLFRQPVLPYLFVAPRGLITILLFLSITADKKIGAINNPVVIQVVLITALLMMFGLMAEQKKGKTEAELQLNTDQLPQ